MLPSPEVCYGALISKDARFDGLFFVGVKTTGIYCRPVCRARRPRPDGCSFFRAAAEAERDGYRACFRCRPELAPGSSREESIPRLVAAAARRIEAGALNEISLDQLARELSVSDRHLRRAMRSALGVSPVELAQYVRMALARRLLEDSALPVTEVALASGFRSVRRFNALFRARFGRSPSSLRRATSSGGSAAGDVLTLRLAYRPPYDWASQLEFLQVRAVRAAELVSADTYVRTVRIGRACGVISVKPHARRTELEVKASLSLADAVAPLVFRLRRAFDLDAEPQAISRHLGADARLRGLVRRRPGLRLAGAFDAFETLVRAVLGQQVSVSSATTLFSRLVERFGEPIRTPEPGLARLMPSAERLAEASEAALASIGIPLARARALRGVALLAAGGGIALDALSDPVGATETLSAVPGVGAWTLGYFALRALPNPDAFLASDLGVRRALGRVSAAQALAIAEPWRPWRAYATMHLWRSLDDTGART